MGSRVRVAPLTEPDTATDVEVQQADTAKSVVAPAEGGSSMIGGLVAVFVVIAITVVVVVLVLGGDDAAAATASPSAGPTSYFVSSGVTLAGVTAAQFTGAARTQFSTTVMTPPAPPRPSSSVPRRMFENI